MPKARLLKNRGTVRLKQDYWKMGQCMPKTRLLKDGGCPKKKINSLNEDLR